MKVLGGVFDFDKLNCLVMIDDSDDDGEFSGEPKRFTVEVTGSPRIFTFEAPSSVLLKKWTQAIYANWHEGKGFRK